MFWEAMELPVAALGSAIVISRDRSSVCDASAMCSEVLSISNVSMVEVADHKPPSHTVSRLRKEARRMAALIRLFEIHSMRQHSPSGFRCTSHYICVPMLAIRTGM